MSATRSLSRAKRTLSRPPCGYLLRLIWTGSPPVTAPSNTVCALERETAALSKDSRCRDYLREVLGAGDRDRTDDIQLGKLTFYH